MKGDDDVPKGEVGKIKHLYVSKSEADVKFKKESRKLPFEELKAKEDFLNFFEDVYQGGKKNKTKRKNTKKKRKKKRKSRRKKRKSKKKERNLKVNKKVLR